MQFHCGSRNAREEGVKSVEERASDKTVMALLAPPSENTPVSPRRGLGLPPQLQRWRVVGLPSTLPDLPYWFPYCFPGPSLFFVIILNLLTGRSSSRGPRGAPHCSRDVDSLRSPPARLAGSAKLTSTSRVWKNGHTASLSLEDTTKKKCFYRVYLEKILRDSWDAWLVGKIQCWTIKGRILLKLGKKERQSQNN